MNIRFTGSMLFAAAICFWTSWVLMPGVGITDAATILRLVGAQPDRVLASSVLQLISAALLALAIPGLALRFNPPNDPWGRSAVALLAIGACGDAADAIYHQLAYEMVRPGVDQAAMLPVMERIQTADLPYLLPLIFAFLAGCIILAIDSARSGIVAKWNPMLYALCLIVVVVGRVAGFQGRTMGMTCLGLLSVSLCWIGIAIGQPSEYKEVSVHVKARF